MHQILSQSNPTFSGLWRLRILPFASNERYAPTVHMCCVSWCYFHVVGYTMDVMYFSWLDNTVDIDQGLQLPQFFLEDHVLYDCSQNYTAGITACMVLAFIQQHHSRFFLSLSLICWISYARESIWLGDMRTVGSPSHCRIWTARYSNGITIDQLKCVYCSLCIV